MLPNGTSLTDLAIAKGYKHVTPQPTVHRLCCKKATRRFIVGVTWCIGWLCKHWYAESVFWHLSHLGKRSQSGPTCNKQQKKGILIFDFFSISMQPGCLQRRCVFRDDAEKGGSLLCWMRSRARAYQNNVIRLINYEPPWDADVLRWVIPVQKAPPRGLVSQEILAPAQEVH